jgi:hypothetical protein
MRKMLFGLFGFAAIGIGALAAQPAEAQPYYGGYGWGGPALSVQYGPGPRYREYRRPYRAYRPYGAYGPRPYYARPAYVGRRCFVRPGRPIWNGYRWVRPPVRVCRW